MFWDPWGLVEVGFRAYAETYSGATVSWDETTQTATASWNGKTLSVTANGENYRDGRIYIDDSEFINAFGVGDERMVVYEDEITGNRSVRVNFNITDNTVGASIDGISYVDAFLTGVSESWTVGNLATYAGQNSTGFVVSINSVTSS